MKGFIILCMVQIVLPALLFANTLNLKKEMKTLLGFHNLDIPTKNIHCEVNGPSESGPDDNLVYQPVKVGDLLADYLALLASKEKNIEVQFSCQKQRNKQVCRFVYGESKSLFKKHPGWNMILKYDKIEGQVDPKSFECIQIP